MQLLLTPEHAYVLAAAVAMHFTNFGLGMQVDAARAKYKIIKPPNMYATKGMFFNKAGEFDEKSWVEVGEAFNRRQRGVLTLLECLLLRGKQNSSLFIKRSSTHA